jgi:hypothetical protein
MHEPPPNAAVSVFEQNDIEPLPSVKAQQRLLLDSVQSEFLLHKRSCWVPLHDMPVLVGHCAAGAHATTGGSVVQLGIEPPVTFTSAQQTLPPEQSVVDAQVVGAGGAASWAGDGLAASFADGVGDAASDLALLPPPPASAVTPPDVFAEGAPPPEAPVSSVKPGPPAELHAQRIERERAGTARRMFFIQKSITTRFH